MSFYESAICRSREHCELCRAQTVAGATFRADIRAVFPVTERGWDFACPDGKPYGWRPSLWRRIKARLQKFAQTWRAARGWGSRIKALTDAAGVKQCGGCAQRQEQLDRSFPVGVK